METATVAEQTNTASTPTSSMASPEMKAQVLSAINKVRPALQADGGDMELVEVTDDGVVMVRLHGACGGCPMSTMTLTYGIERFLRQQVPGVTQLVPVE